MAMSKAGCTALLIAAQRGNLEVVDLLLSSDPSFTPGKEETDNVRNRYTIVDVNEIIFPCFLFLLLGQEGSTALILAAKGGFLDIVTYLIDNGSDLRRMNNVRIALRFCEFQFCVHY